MAIPLIYPYQYAWKTNPRRAELKDRPCRIVARGSSMRSILIEFEDGERVVTSARAVKARSLHVQDRLPLA